MIADGPDGLYGWRPRHTGKPGPVAKVGAYGRVDVDVVNRMT